MSSARWENVKSLWNAGQKWQAIVFLNVSISNITYPGGGDEMDRLFDQYKYWKFTGPMAGVTWWREVWHFLGGLAITLPFLYFYSVCFWVPLAIMVWKSAAEFYSDGGGSPDLKNFVDVLFWVLGSASVTIVSFLLFGPATYK
jgi:hypothetical protein